MNSFDSNEPQVSSRGSDASRHWWRGPLEQLKTKQIAWLTVPLIIMATVTEFVILATGWKYQQQVCVPRGMGVTFFGIGPIGATILAVELLKLPLAIWTASRSGFQKFFMIFCGLPLICLLTFQLVKDMAVYEMGVALAPAEQMLKNGDSNEIKIKQLNAELSVIDQKKTDRDAKLADLAARKTKANADFQDQLKHIDDQRTDAISLTDYQKKELADEDGREAFITQQFDADATKLKQTLVDLRAQRDQEVAADAKWNAEEARLDNEFQAQTAKYENAKAAYLNAVTEYAQANIIKKQFLKEPVYPGVPPVREVNTVLKPTRLADIDAQIKAREADLAMVDQQRRQRVTQVEDEAKHLRSEFDTRSDDRRGDSDRKRDALVVAQAAANTKFAAEEADINSGYDATAQKADGIRAEIDANRKEAAACYEARVTAIENTQVHRIATTVEIIRGLLLGKHPVSITLTPKERGDLYTDQISMVRIWVYPVLAFIVAFLPTLMVEIGFSTIFKPEAEVVRKKFRMGFLGRRLHEIYIRAGRQKVLRAERLAQRATGELAVRSRELATAKDATVKVVADKEAELAATRESLNAASASRLELLKQADQEHEQALKHRDEEFALALKRKEQEHEMQAHARTEEWVAKMANLADSLHRVTLEKDAMRDLQKSEIERQIQMRQHAWSDRFTQMRQELDDQRTAAETERLALMQTHQKKLLETTEDYKAQVTQARRQAATAELTATEATAKLTLDLKEVLSARDKAEEQMRQQAETFNVRLLHARDESAHELDKAVRQEKHRFELLQTEFSQTLRQRDEDAAHKLKQREQELSLAFDARLAEEQTKLEEAGRRSKAEVERQLEVRAQEVDARWKQELQQREEAAQARLHQREHQWQSQSESRLAEVQAAAQQELNRAKEDAAHELDMVLRQEKHRSGLLQTELNKTLRQREEDFAHKLKQREQELALEFDARLAEEQTKLEEASRRSKAEVERRFDLRAQEVDARWKQEAQQRDEAAQIRLRQLEHQLQAQTEARLVEAQVAAQQELHRHEADWQHRADARVREVEARWGLEQQQKELAHQTKLKQREQELITQLCAQHEARIISARTQWVAETEKQVHAALEPVKAMVTRAEKERDEAVQTAAESAAHVQHLEKKLRDVSVFINSWGHANGHRNGNGIENGNSLVVATS